MVSCQWWAGRKGWLHLLQSYRLRPPLLLLLMCALDAQWGPGRLLGFARVGMFDLPLLCDRHYSSEEHPTTLAGTAKVYANPQRAYLFGIFLVIYYGWMHRCTLLVAVVVYILSPGKGLDKFPNCSIIGSVFPYPGLLRRQVILCLLYSISFDFSNPRPCFPLATSCWST